MPRNLTITTSGTDDAELADRQILFADGGAADFALTASLVSSTLETGNTQLQANNDIIVSDAVTAASGGHDLIVQAGRTITVSAAVTADGAGAITLVANNTDTGETDAGGGALTGSGASADRDTGAGNLVVNAAISSGSGTIKLVSSGASTNGGVPGNVSLAAGISTTGTVVVRATGGAITQAAGTVTATSLALVAATGVNLNGDAGTLAGSVSAAGAGFTYVDANALTIGTAGGVTGITTNGGTVQLTVGGNLTVAAAVDAGTANVNFFSAISSLSFINQSSVGSSGGNVASRFDDYDLQAGSSITVAANREVNLRVATGGVGMDLGSTGPGAAFSQAEIDTVTAGQLRFTSAADINVSSGVTFNPAKVTTLVLEAVGGVTDGTAVEQTDITATNLALKMSNGAGSADDLDTAVSVLAFRNVTSGNINISNAGALTIGSVFDVTTSTNMGGGTTAITASSALTFAVNTTSAGNATYTAGENNDAPGGADDLTINAGVTVSVTAGTLTLQAGDDIVINGQASASGAITITAAFNDLDGLGGVVNNGLITGDSVDIHAVGDISVGRVSAGTLAGLTTTADAIIDSNATGADITASSVSLSAATGIGSAGGANAISTEATTLTATNSTSGHISIIEATGVDLAGITNNASGGNVSIATLDGSITTSAAIVATGAGNITLATAGAGSTLSISNTATTGSGTVDLTADAMALTAAITGSSVALRNTTAGQAIDLGGADAAGTLGLTSAELDTVTATGGTLTIGRTDAGASGTITISSAIAPTGAASLMLRTGGAITQTGGTVTATSLALVAATGVSLSDANDSGTLAGSVSGAGAAFSYADANALTVGTAGGVTGITTNGGTVQLSVGGNLTVAAAVDAGTANVSLIANASSLSFINQSSVGSSGGNVQSRFDDYDLQVGSSLTVAANREVNLRVATGGVGIGLGSTGSGASFSQAEIDTVTAGQLRFTAAADITVSSAVTFNSAKVATLVLEALSGIQDATASEQTDLTATSLAIKTSTGIGAFDDLDTAVSVLAFRNQTSGNVNISNTGALTIGSVFDVTTSTNSGGGTTTITASSPLTFAVNTTSVGSATYTAGESNDAPAGADDLTTNAGVTVSVTTGTLTLQAGDDIVINGTTGAFGAVTVTAAFNDLDGLGGVVNNGLIESTGAGVDIHAIGDISVGRVSAGTSAGLTTTAGAIIDSNATGADITASSVSLSAATGIGSAGGANAISTEATTLTATNSTSGNISIIEATGVDLAGITNNASGGNVSIATLDGSITTSAAIAATGNIALATAGAGSTLTISNTVTTFSGTVDLTADAMALNPAGITASSVALRNTTAGQAIDLGGADAAGTLGLTSAELNTVIATGGALTIGRNDASASGNITISSAIAPTGAPSLMLRTGGAITQSAGAAVANLALVAGTGVALTNAGNDVANLSGLVTGTGDFSHTDVNAVTVSGHGAVNADTSIGIRTTNGAIALTGTQISLAAGLITDNLGNASNVTLTGPVEVFAASVAIDTDQTAGGNAGNVTFTSTVDGIVAGINTLIVDARETGPGAGAGGTVTFGGAVGSGMRLAGLAVAGSGVSFTGTNNVGTLAIALSGAANGVSYTDADALTVGIAGGVTGITTNNGAVTLTAGAITVSAALSTTAAVTLNASGITTLGVALSGIGSLTTDAAGTTTINGGAVTTTGAQTYQDAVTLGGTTTLTSTASGNLSFAGTIDGTFGLTVNSSGTTTLGGVLGGTDRLLSVTTDAAGTTAFNADGSLSGVSVGTTGAQTYNDAVTLGASTFLVSDSGGAITLGKTIDGSAGPARALTVTTSGAVTFGGAVGSTFALDALTTNGGGPVAINGGSVTTTNAQSYDVAVTLGAATALTGGSVAFHGTVSNGGFGLTVHTDAGSFDGVVSGSGGLTLASTAPNSAAVATTTLSAANLYTGATTVDSGTLALGGAGSIAGSSQVNLTSASAAFDLSATTSGATIVSLNGVAGSHVELGARTLTLSGAAHGYAGIIEGAGGLTLAGGTETLSGVNTYVGATAVNGGTLLVDGAIAASILTTVANGGTLGGNGAAGAVTVASGGTLAPGASAGDLAVGNLSLASGATLRIELGGTGAGTGYDQLDVNGTVALGGATLALSLIGGFTPAAGTTFTIIDNNASDAVSGTFLGLAEGAVLSAGGYAFAISYHGGDGNDVVLQAAAVGTPGDDTFTAPPGSASINGGGGIDTITFSFKLTDATVSYVDNTIVIDGPSSRTVLTGFERFVFSDGTADNADGNPLVDDLFYYAQNHDVWTARADADFHYGIFGWKEGRDPSAFFDTAIYLSANPDVAASGANPLTHYDTVGWQQGRVPSLTFDTRAYLDANPDVKAAHIDPLLHFLGVGASEGRQPIAPTELATANSFDYVYYLAHNPDVAAAGVDPLWHFQNIGWTEGRNPNAYFDTAGYLGVYTDVAAAHINPLDHFHQSGWQEGRDPSLTFDTDSYLAANPDVAAAHVDPLAHFLHSGHYEGRIAIADAAWG